MTPGLVFDVRELTIHDGPGIRTTVFLKGCPLRCAWCHNPQGLSSRPETIRGTGGARQVGTWWEPAGLAAVLNAQGPILRAGEGGVTFSGGEPLAQAAFVAETIDLLDGLDIVLDTSGHGSADAFLALAGRASLVHFDLKLVDPVTHRRWTGRDNGPVLENLRLLTSLGTPCVIRVPLIPGVTDTPANLAAVARLAAGVAGLQAVHLLPYNRAAGGNWAACGRTFRPGFDEKVPPNANISVFERFGLPVLVA